MAVKYRVIITIIEPGEAISATIIVIHFEKTTAGGPIAHKIFTGNIFG